MRGVFLGLIVGVPLLASVLMALAVLRMRGLVRRVPQLRDEEDMRRFKRLAATQMYVALAMLPVLLLPAILWFVGMCMGILKLGDLVWLIVPVLLQVGVGQWGKAGQRKVEDLPAATSALKAERDRVVHTWNKKALPDW